MHFFNPAKKFSNAMGKDYRQMVSRIECTSSLANINPGKSSQLVTYFQEAQMDFSTEICHQCISRKKGVGYCVVFCMVQEKILL